MEHRQLNHANEFHQLFLTAIKNKVLITLSVWNNEVELDNNNDLIRGKYIVSGSHGGAISTVKVVEIFKEMAIKQALTTGEVAEMIIIVDKLFYKIKGELAQQVYKTIIDLEIDQNN